jgi:single-stranded-DNA-specific exonuclease
VKYILGEEIPDKYKKELERFHPLVQKLLYYRGIKNKDDADIFVNPKYEEGLHDPFLLPNMEQAVSRILETIEKKEKIAIYSDYDADGIPGGVILHDFFKKIEFENFLNYIPHRHEEGFGLHKSAIDKLAKDSVELIITVDCGIGGVKQAKHASKLGIDLIITDHHEANGSVPTPAIIVNPKIDGAKYPNQNICGAGVVFKLVQGLIEKGNFSLVEGWEKWLLDMVGLATLSDMVSLTGENRILALYGLKVLQKSRRSGLVRLLKRNRVLQRMLTQDDVSFIITPRINAASRMDCPEYAFQMLVFDDHIEADNVVAHLEKLNRERKTEVAKISKTVNARLKKMEIKHVIALGNPHWRPSLLGLVANSLSDKYHRPVFLWGRDGQGLLKGSCRSDDKIDLIELMSASDSETFSEFGGHKFSGGFAVSQNQVHFLEQRLNDAFEHLGNKREKDPTFVDSEIDISEIDYELYRQIDQLSPFGIGNPKPQFLLRGVSIKEIKYFGTGGLHLELILTNGEKNISAISFFCDREEHGFGQGDKIDLIVFLEKSSFRGRSELRLRIAEFV